MSVTLLGSLMEWSIILISSDIDLGIVLQQKPYHRQISKVCSHVYRSIAGLGLALDVCPVFYQDRRHPDEIFLRAQMQRRKPVLKSTIIIENDKSIIFHDSTLIPHKTFDVTIPNSFIFIYFSYFLMYSIYMQM